MSPRNPLPLVMMAAALTLAGCSSEDTTGSPIANGQATAPRAEYALDVDSSQGAVRIALYPIDLESGVISQSSSSSASFTIPALNSTSVTGYDGPFFSSTRDILYLPLTCRTASLLTTEVYALSINPRDGTLQNVTGSPFSYSNLGNEISKLGPNEDFLFTFGSSTPGSASVPIQSIAIHPDGSLAQAPVVALNPTFSAGTVEFCDVLGGLPGSDILDVSYTVVPDGPSTPTQTVQTFPHPFFQQYQINSGGTFQQASSQANAAAAAFESAFQATVPPSVIAANRQVLASLVQSNLFGQNNAAIASTEALYAEMWAQDVAAQHAYAAGSTARRVHAASNGDITLDVYPVSPNGEILSTIPSVQDIPGTAGASSTPLAFSPNGTLAYSFVTPAGGDTAQLLGWSVDPTSEALTALPGSPFATVSVDAEGPFLSVIPEPTGRFLYVSAVRSTTNTLTAYSIAQNGGLTQMPSSLQTLGLTGLIVLY